MVTRVHGKLSAFLTSRDSHFHMYSVVAEVLSCSAVYCTYKHRIPNRRTVKIQSLLCRYQYPFRVIPVLTRSVRRLASDPVQTSPPHLPHSCYTALEEQHATHHRSPRTNAGRGAHDDAEYPSPRGGRVAPSPRREKTILGRRIPTAARYGGLLLRASRVEKTHAVLPLRGEAKPCFSSYDSTSLRDCKSPSCA